MFKFRQILRKIPKPLASPPRWVFSSVPDCDIIGKIRNPPGLPPPPPGVLPKPKIQNKKTVSDDEKKILKKRATFTSVLLCIVFSYLYVTQVFN